MKPQADISLTMTMQQNPTDAPMDDEEEDEEDPAALLMRLPIDTTALRTCLWTAQGCLLLLVLKQHLKATYGMSDA